MKKLLLILFFILLATTIGEGGFYFGSLYQQQQNLSLNSTVNTSPQNSNSANVTPLVSPKSQLFSEVDTSYTNLSDPVFLKLDQVGAVDNLVYGDLSIGTISAKSAIRPNVLLPILRILEQPQDMLSKAQLDYKLTGVVTDIKVNGQVQVDGKSEDWLKFTIREPKSNVIFGYYIWPSKPFFQVSLVSQSSHNSAPSDIKTIKVGDTIEFEQDLDLLTQHSTIKAIRILVP